MPKIDHFDFVVPDDHDLPSGGNLWNSTLLVGMRALRLRAEQATLSTLRMPDDPEVDHWLLIDSALGKEGVLQAQTRSPRAITHVVAHLIPSALTDYSKLGVLGVVATGPLAAREMKERCSNLTIIEVAPPAIIVPRAQRSPPTTPRLLMVASLIRTKGVLDLIRALTTTVQPDDAFELLIAGRVDLEPEVAREVQGRVAESPLLRKHVRLLGPVSPADMPALYDSASCLVTASLQETYGLALAEARHFGIPVLGLRSPWLEHHVQNENHGLLFSNIEALVTGCLRFVRDPNLRARAQSAAYEHRLINARTATDAARDLVQGLRVSRALRTT